MKAILTALALVISLTFAGGQAMAGGGLSTGGQDMEQKIGEILAKLPDGYTLNITGDDTTNVYTYSILNPQGQVEASVTGNQTQAVNSIYAQWNAAGAKLNKGNS